MFMLIVIVILNIVTVYIYMYMQIILAWDMAKSFLADILFVLSLNTLAWQVGHSSKDLAA